MKSAARRWVFVFSHPNHELAVFGHLQRLRPRLVFLTDGGGPEREAETRRGLDRLGLRGHADFLGHGEGEFYAGLVARDVGFFAEVARRLRKALERDPPTDVACDAVELYNPVHDLSLPIVRHAVAALGTARVHEVPLIHERAAEEGAYEVQRFPAADPREHRRLVLRDDELAAKLAARDEVYGLLRAQLGPVLEGSPEHHRVEEIGPAGTHADRPDGPIALRYERRGRLLHERGEVAEVITWADHYRPVADALVADAQAPEGSLP